MRSIACCEPLLVLHVHKSQAGPDGVNVLLGCSTAGGGSDGGRYHYAALLRARSIEGHGLRCEI